MKPTESVSLIFAQGADKAWLLTNATEPVRTRDPEASKDDELKNAQAIVLAYDGLNPLPPTYCYLKPYFLDPTVSYFEYLKKGLL